MLTCPHCSGCLPIQALVKFDVACPHCGAELEPKRLTLLIPVIVVSALVNFGGSRLAGYLHIPAAASDMVRSVVGIGLWIPFCLQLGRFREVPKPLSILR